MKKNNWITFIVIIAVVILALFLMKNPSPKTDEETAKCIGENSEFYVRLGCTHCEAQKEMFGEYVSYLNTVDCFFEREICTQKGIEATPTWIINGEKIVGTQEISKLKELTGC